MPHHKKVDVQNKNDAKLDSSYTLKHNAASNRQNSTDPNNCENDRNDNIGSITRQECSKFTTGCKLQMKAKFQF